MDRDGGGEGADAFGRWQGRQPGSQHGLSSLARFHRFAAKFASVAAARSKSRTGVLVDVAWKTLQTVLARADKFHVLLQNDPLLQSCTQALAYDRWAETAEATRAKRKKLVGMVTRMTQGKVVAAWNSWTDMVSARERSRAALERGLRMLPGSVGHAWNSWIEVYNEQRHKGKAMQKFVLKLINRAAVLAFESWVELAAEEGAKKARMVRKRKLFSMRKSRPPGSRRPPHVSPEK
jgi:hypothetical protein